MVEFTKQTTSALLSALLLYTLTGCHKTTLEPGRLSPEVFRLASTSSVPLALQISRHQDADIGGNQYLLVLLPFGGVSVESPLLTVEHAAYHKLAQAGFRPLPAQTFAPQPTTIPTRFTLHIEIQQLRASAFDFLFFRRVSARATLRLKIVGPDQIPVFDLESHGKHAQLRRYGFSQELGQALEQALSEALEPAITTLRRKASR